jgi:hypothetical protein
MRRPRAGFAVDVTVLDRLFEDRYQAVDQLPDRRRAERPDATAPLVAQHRPRLKRVAYLGCLTELRGLELLTERGVNLVQREPGEQGQQMLRQAPAVVSCGVGVDRAVADAAVRLALEPGRRVLVERRHACGHRGFNGLALSPDTGLDPSEVLSSSTAAVRSVQPPPHPQSRRSWSTRLSRRPLAWNRSLKARVPSASVVTLIWPVAFRLIAAVHHACSLSRFIQLREHPLLHP